MMHKTLIRMEDYNEYVFDISTSNIKLFFSKLRLEQYIFSELEKVHPFFGTHCKVDFRKVIKNKKLCVFATVMDRILMATYQSKSKNKGLYIIDSTKKKKRLIKIFDHENTNVKRVMAVCILCVFFVSVVYAMRNMNTRNNTVQVIDVQETKAELVYDFSKLFFLNIESWLESGATLTHFSYRTHQYGYENHDDKTNIEVTLMGLHPEMVLLNDFDISQEIKSLYASSIQVSPTTFKNNIPQLHLFFSDTYSNKSLTGQVNKSLSDNSIVRDAVLLFGGNIQEENWERQSYRFSLPVDTWSDFFFYVYESLSKASKTFSEFSFVCEEAATSVSANITLKEGATIGDFVFLNTIFNKQSALYSERSRQNVQTEYKQEEKALPAQSEEKIGNIRKSDGSVVSFYTNKDGKIIVKNE